MLSTCLLADPRSNLAEMLDKYEQLLDTSLLLSSIFCQATAIQFLVNYCLHWQCGAKLRGQWARSH